MKFKEVYLEFNKTYIELNSLTRKLVEKIKPKSTNDALIIHEIKNKSKGGIYLKHDFAKIKNISKKYNVNISKLIELMNKYKALEIKLKGFEKKFKDIGIEDLDFGSFSITGNFKEISEGITITLDKNNIKVVKMTGLKKYLN
jgi:hypothetical protein